MQVPIEVPIFAILHGNSNVSGIYDHNSLDS